MKSLDTISKKITLLNDTTLISLSEKNKLAIIKNFAETGIKILEADFGFVWWKFREKEEYKLAYKSKTTPFEPYSPRKGGVNSTAIKTKRPFFDSHIKKENYPQDFHLYVKSHITIPVWYGRNIYGTLILCYKKKRKFASDEVTLATTLGNTMAQTITIYRLAEKERETFALYEKQKATELLLAEEKSKTEFIANTTHEFRTPLSIIRGYTDLALGAHKGNLKQSQNYMKIINEEVIHLSDMISDLVLITTHKNVDISLHSEVLNISQILKHTAERLVNIAKKKNVSIEVNTHAKNLSIKGDKKYIERLFLNLIENAITYSKNNEKGKITIDIAETEKFALISIKDHGVGISKEDIPNIFERFYRSDKSHNSYGKHSGLGLSMVKWITEMHGGKISVESELGLGSTFVVTLPLKKNK